MAYAIYRLPFADRCFLIRQTSGQPEELPSPTELSGREGFVVAPFSLSEETPMLLIRPDEVEEISLMSREEWGVRSENSSSIGSENSFSMRSENTSRSEIDKSNDDSASQYRIDFANFHAQLQQGAFQKLVLARRVREHTAQEVKPMDLFYSACRLYPRMFISLVSSERSGTWLTASPEVLIDGEGDSWRTMALAGTMRYTEQPEWNDKNREEQQLVATYITETLEHFTGDFTEEGPYTTRAADLAHLRSDFRFRLTDPRCIGELLGALHPTPAVCGLPKQRAFEFIRHNESAPRRYYSGFMGPLFPLTAATHIYVSLRCMQIIGTDYDLYAGGGILPESVMEQEWQETEMKLETMRQCLRTTTPNPTE